MDAYDQWDIEHPVAIYGSCDLNGIVPNPNNTVSRYICMNKNLQNHLKYLTPEAIKQWEDENAIEH